MEFGRIKFFPLKRPTAISAQKVPLSCSAGAGDVLKTIQNGE
jgi:hypothetical protein